MHHKSLNILIKRRLSKFLSIDDFDLADSWKGFFDGLGFPSELFLSKLNIIIAKGKERHA